MTVHMHPEVAAVLQRAKRLQTLMDDALAKLNSDTYTATDDRNTVEVTLDRRHRMTIVEFDAERSGPANRRDRIGDAVRRATAMADESRTAESARIESALADITGNDSPGQSRGDDE